MPRIFKLAESQHVRVSAHTLEPGQIVELALAGQLQPPAGGWRQLGGRPQKLFDVSRLAAFGWRYGTTLQDGIRKAHAC